MIHANLFFYKFGYWPDLMQYLNDHCGNLLDADAYKKNFVQICLEMNNDTIDSLLGLLSLVNVSKPVLMPSYDNAAEYVLNLKRFRKKFRY